VISKTEQLNNPWDNPMNSPLKSDGQRQANVTSGSLTDLIVRPLRESDLDVADRIFRLAFGTFVGMPDPSVFAAGREFVRARWRANPSGAFGAVVDDELVGSNLCCRWGRVAFFGPLSVRPDFWDRGVAKRLLERTVQLFDSWEIRHAGLFTFAQSAKHVGLYQKFGYWPRFLTAIMSRPMASVTSVAAPLTFSRLSHDQQAEAIRACRELTCLVFDGLDLASEIRAVHEFNLGDTVLLWTGAELSGFAVCQYGPGSEGGPVCYVKFGAVRPHPAAGETFDRLLEGCEALAADQKLEAIEAGVSLAREDAYKRMLRRGFRTGIQGIAMHKPNRPAYDRPDAYVLDDWR
jgi:GNAT superfamily N-acetyltransferase